MSIDAALQLNMFGPPEPVSSYPESRLGRCDDAPVACERENLWPSDLAATLGTDLLERLYGDVPRRTRLYVREVCRRLRCDSQHVYDLIGASLDATDIGTPGSSRHEWRVYRYSLVTFLFNRDFRDGQTRCNLPAGDMQRVENAVRQLREAHKEACGVGR